MAKLPHHLKEIEHIERIESDVAYQVHLSQQCLSFFFVFCNLYPPHFFCPSNLLLWQSCFFITIFSFSSVSTLFPLFIVSLYFLFLTPYSFSLLTFPVSLTSFSIFYFLHRKLNGKAKPLPKHGK